MRRLLFLAITLLLLGSVQLHFDPDTITAPRWHFFIGTPAEASYRPTVIKQIQRGVISWSNAASATATLSPAVNTSNSVIHFLGYTNGDVDQADLIGRVELTNSTTVTAYRYNTGAPITVVSWEVVEYYPRVVRSVQRGTLTQSAGTVNRTITAVTSLSKTTVDYLGYRINHSFPNPTWVWPSLQLTSVTNLSSTSSSAGGQEVGWQVVNWY